MTSSSPAWSATVLTLFPDMFPGPLGMSLAGRGLQNNIWDLDVVNIRDFSEDIHRSVDDAPFGGGAGMLMKPDVVHRAVVHGLKDHQKRIFLTPRGTPLSQKRLKELSLEKNVMLLCGHFEGIDQRVLDHWSFEEVSVGDYVLSGGELAAMLLIDGVVRLLPGVVGTPESLNEESFENDLLEYPHYTRPQVWEGRSVPEVLLSGHHRHIAEWRQREAEKLTQERRPDLWQRYAQFKKMA